MKRKITFLWLIRLIFSVLFLLLIIFIVLSIVVDMNIRNNIFKKNDDNALTAYLNKYYPERLSSVTDNKSKKTSSTTSLSLDAKTKERLIVGDGDNFWLGAKNPQVTIVEFADFSCPYCKASFPNVREISLRYKNKIKFIFRDLPIIHDYSVLLALAARCAGEQNKFWLMHDQLFINDNINQREKINFLANKINLNINKFNSCLDTQKFLNAIKKDLADAQALGIDKLGTPIFFINNKQINGAIPRADLNKIIKSLIK